MSVTLRGRTRKGRKQSEFMHDPKVYRRLSARVHEVAWRVQAYTVPARTVAAARSMRASGEDEWKVISVAPFDHDLQLAPILCLTRSPSAGERRRSLADLYSVTACLSNVARIAANRASSSDRRSRCVNTYNSSLRIAHTARLATFATSMAAFTSSANLTMVAFFELLPSGLKPPRSAEADDARSP